MVQLGIKRVQCIVGGDTCNDMELTGILRERAVRACRQNVQARHTKSSPCLGDCEVHLSYHRSQIQVIDNQQNWDDKKTAPNPPVGPDSSRGGRTVCCHADQRQQQLSAISFQSVDKGGKSVLGSINTRTLLFSCTCMISRLPGRVLMARPPPPRRNLRSRSWPLSPCQRARAAAVSSIQHQQQDI